MVLVANELFTVVVCEELFCVKPFSAVENATFKKTGKIKYLNFNMAIVMRFLFPYAVFISNVRGTY